MITVYLLLSGIIISLVFLNRRATVNYFLILSFLALQWWLTGYTYVHMNEVLSGYFKADALSVLLLAVLGVICAPSLYHSYVYFKKFSYTARQRAIYFSALIVLITSMSAAYLSGHIAVTWVFIELTTISASALVYHRRNARCLEGTWKYIFVCSVSISFVFIGILFLSIAMNQAGATDLSYDSLNRHAALLDAFWVRLAFIFAFTGLTVKAGLVPMYTAGIDAKDKAPSPAGALLATALMNVGFAGIFRLYEMLAHTDLYPFASDIAMLSGLLSVFVAAVYMVKVRNLKRLLAYSGVEHIGIVMLGIAAGGIGYYASVLHIILHTLAKSGLFFQAGQVYRIYKSKNIGDSGNYVKYNPPGAIAMLFGFICVAAIPPSGLFVSEFLIARSLFEGHHFVSLALLFALLSVILWGFGKNIFRLLFTPPVKELNEQNIEKISVVESLPQFVLIGLVIYIGLHPPATLTALIHEAIKNLPQ